MPRPPILIALVLLSSLLFGCDETQRARIQEVRDGVEQASERIQEVREGVREATDRIEETTDAFKEVAAAVALPPKREEALGDRMAAEIAGRSRVLSRGPVVSYVEGLGAGIVGVVDDREEAIDFDFHVLDDPEINAFAIPGGHIYVTTGLLQSADTEAELVAVLGHEIAHVTRRHIAERMAAAYGVSTLTDIALGQQTSALGQIAAELLGRGYLLKHSRDDEREADTHGMTYVIAAGHSPVGFATFFDRLAEQPRPPAILSTHPDPEERAKRARETIAAMEPAIVERPVHRERYLKAVVGLPR